MRATWIRNHLEDRLGLRASSRRLERTPIRQQTPATAMRQALRQAGQVAAGTLLALALLLRSAPLTVASEAIGSPTLQIQAEKQVSDPEAAGHPEDNLEAVRKAYLTLLFQEVNVRRDHAASPPFEMMLDTGNEAVNAYLIELTPLMEQRRACFHGSDIVGLRAGWDYLPDFGVQNQVGGEVLACPDVDAGGFWTPPGIADGWWRSPHHFHTLYADPRPNAVACGAYNQIRGKNAYETVACITLLPDGAP